MWWILGIIVLVCWALGSYGTKAYEKEQAELKKKKNPNCKCTTCGCG